MKNIKLLVSFGIGAACGGAIAYILTKKHYEKVANEEIEEVKEHFHDRVVETTKRRLDILEEMGYITYSSDKKFEDFDDENDEELPEINEKREKFVDYTSYYESSGENLVGKSSISNKKEEKHIQNEENDEETEEEDYIELDKEADEALNKSDFEPPYEISFEEFLENGIYEKETITYYEKDDTLADENEEIMALSDVGEECLGHFVNGVVYVRNERLGMDFEILRSPRSYSSYVLGIEEDSQSSRSKKRRFADEDEEK